MSKWFTREWWQYLLEPKGKWNDVSWFTIIWCRMRGHSGGVVFYNASGLEPDMTCRNCGDDLG